MNKVSELEKALAEKDQELRDLRGELENAKSIRAVLDESLPLGIVILSGKDLRIQFVNHAYLNLIPDFSGDAVGRKWRDIWKFENSKQVEADLVRALETGEPLQSAFFKRVFQDGTVINSQFSAVPINWNGERSVLSYLSDISPEVEIRRRAESLAAESRYNSIRLEAIFHAIADSIIEYDPTGTVVRANAAAVQNVGAALVGLTRAEVSMVISLRYPDGTPVPVDRMPSRRVMKGETIVHEIYKYTNVTTGEEKTQMVSAVPLKGQEGELSGAVVTWTDITQLEKAVKVQEDLLAENNRQKELLERLIRDAPAGIAFLDGPDHRYTLANSAYREIARDKPELIGRMVAEIWPELNSEIVPLLDEVYRSGKAFTAYDQPYRISRRDGYETDYFTFTFTPVASNDGQVEGIMILAIETTDRVTASKQLEKDHRMLMESEERFRQLADSMPQLVWTAGPDGRVDYYNKRQEEYKGISLDERGDYRWAPVLHPDDVSLTEDVWTQAVENGEIYQVEHRVCMADGSYRWHLSRGLPVVDENGTVVKWYGTATDIHVQKLVEEALRISEARLRRLFEANLMGVVYINKSGSIIDANEVFLEMMGYTSSELESDALTWPDMTPLQMYSSEYSKPFETEYIRKDGSHLPVLVGVTALDESETNFIAFVLDMTRVNAAEASLQEYATKLEQSNEELRRFAFVASHDLQEPLRKIRSFGDRLITRLESSLDEDSRIYLERMIDASNRMSAMIQGLLDLSRVSYRGTPFQPVDLNALTADVLSDLEPLIKSTGAVVETGDLPTVEGDPVQLRQLIQNLVANGIKFVKPGVEPYLSITSSQDQTDPGCVMILVSDNGIGFSEEHLQRIFQPFERLVGRSEYEGTGMGLAICQKIVERHGGTITAKSQPGEGSTFLVSLPVRHP